MLRPFMKGKNRKEKEFARFFISARSFRHFVKEGCFRLHWTFPGTCYTESEKNAVLPALLGGMQYDALRRPAVTLRDYTQTAQDLDRSLEQVARMGYQTVQVSAIGPIRPTGAGDLRQARPAGRAHPLEPGPVFCGNTEAVIGSTRSWAATSVSLGMMPSTTPEWLSHFAEDFKEPAKIAAAGKLLMYHNHNISEFQRFPCRLSGHPAGGASPQELGFTLDTYWVQMGGADVVPDWIEKLADTSPCVHLKDMAVRAGSPSWPRWGGQPALGEKILGAFEEGGGQEVRPGRAGHCARALCAWRKRATSI